MDIESSQLLLNQGLAFLYISSGIFLLVVGGFLVKLIYDSSKLVKNATVTTEIVNTELKPTLDELNKTLKTVNEIVQNTGEGVGSVKLGLENILSKTKLMSKNLFGGLLSGFMTVYSLFCKKRK